MPIGRQSGATLWLLVLAVFVVGATAADDPAAPLAGVRAALDDGRYLAAKSAARALVVAAEKDHGQDSLEAAMALDLLVESMWRLDEARLPAARAAAERALAIKSARLDETDAGLVPSLLNLGIIALYEPDLERGSALLERARDLAERAYGPGHRLAAMALVALAAGRKDAGAHDQARELYGRVLAMEGTVLDPGDPELALARHGLGWLEFHARDYGASIDWHEQALADRERTLGPDHPDVARSLVALARAKTAQRQFDQARALYERALTIQEQALGSQHLTLAITLDQLGSVLFSAGDYEGSRAAHERALPIATAALGSHHGIVGALTRSLARTARIFGDLPRSERLYRQALAIETAARGEQHPSLIHTMMGLGWVLYEKGEYAAARQLYEQASAIGESGLGADHPSVAAIRMRFVSLAHAIGDYRLAESIGQRNLEVMRRAYGEDHPQVARCLTGLGNNRLSTERYAEAREFNERALAIARKTLPEDHGTTLGILHNLALALAGQGDHAGAKALFERRLAVQESRWPEGHPIMVETLLALAEQLRLLGEFDRAREFAARAVAICERALGRGHPRTTGSQLALARALDALGDRRGAFDLALTVEEASRDHLRLAAAGLPERQGLRYSSVRADGLDLALSILAEQRAPRPPDLARVGDALVRSRAVVLDAMAARHRSVSGSDDPSVAGVAGELAAARARLAQLVSRGPAGAAPDAYGRLVAAARATKESLESRLAQLSAGFRSARAREQIGIDQVRAALPRRSALVAVVRYEHRGAESRYLALVVRPGAAPPALVRIGAARSVETAVADWRGAVAEPPQGLLGTQARALRESRRVGKKLRELVWDPLVAATVPAERVYLVPDGDLHLVNFEALPIGKRYLIESEMTVQSLTAERDLVPVDRRPGKGRGVLMLGGPDFDAMPEQSRQAFALELAQLAPSSRPRWSPATPVYRGSPPACERARSATIESIPRTEFEVREIARLIRRQGSDGEPATTAVITLTGPAASEEAWKRLAPGRRALHLATHGFFVPAHCAAADSSISSDQFPLGRTVDNPLLRSGLLLAGANRRREIGEQDEDGVLTAEEIASLDLRGTEWAVLSGCETGLGAIQAGEGVLGLRRAFRVAGVESLVMSLWRVEDRATAEWMRRFYEHRLTGSTTAEAVREVNLATLRARREAGKTTHPFYWSAFVATGGSR